MKNFRAAYIGLTALCITFLYACGGGSGGGSFFLPSTINYTQGVFERETQFENACAVPRSGSDLNGNSFRDTSGSTLHEKHWLRSWNNNSYLWYDEVEDRDPADTASVLDYFDRLKTLEVTASGNPKDRFHFTYDSEQWLQLSQSGQSAGYGAEWAIISATPPRKILIAYTEANTPATDASVNLARGAEVLTIDGVDLINSNENLDILNAGLFPSQAGETHTFEVMDRGATQSRTISMTSSIITSPPVLQVSTLPTNDGNIGYLLFNSHNAVAEEQLINAVNDLNGSNISELVLDLRYNGGGLLAIASQLSYMIAGPSSTTSKIFDNIIFNNKHPVTNPITGNVLTPTPFYDQTLGFSVDSGQPLPTLNLSRVFILSTDGTCSASEAIINGLRGIDVEVILIGSTTCGKPYGFYPAENCGTTYFSIQFKGANDKGFGDYSDGFSPANTPGSAGTTIDGCSVADDFNHQLGDSEEALFAAALAYKDTETCPTPTGLSAKKDHLLFQNGMQNIDNPNLKIIDPRPLYHTILGLPQ